MKLKLQKDFLFGFSESGFQFEMGLTGSEDENSDWWQWVHDEENIFSGLVSGDFPEHGPAYWDLYKKDHDIASFLGINCARLGIEWSRIFPKPTFNIEVDFEKEGNDITNIIVDEKALRKLDEVVNKKVLDHYREIFNDWKSRDKKLILNLYHWPLPIWIHDPIRIRKFGLDKSPAGWLDEKTVIEFTKFATYVAWKFDDLVDMWSILNEPNVVYGSGYVQVKSGFPPNLLNIQFAINAAKHLAEAHARAYDNIKYFSKKPIGTIHAMFAVEPLKESDEEAAEKAKNIEVFDFLNLLINGKSMFIGERKDIANHVDWVGINYYSRVVVEHANTVMGFKELEGYGLHCMPNSISRDGKESSDFGWEIYPKGIEEVILDTWKRFSKPIFITENGIADSKDRYRPNFLLSHIAHVQKAMEKGANVKGYLHWALVDNYEWAQGFKMRFGLCHVDYETKKRYLRPSALLFREIIKYHEIDEELIDNT